MRARQAKAAASKLCKCGRPARPHRREPICYRCDEEDSERVNRALPKSEQRD